MAVSYLNLNLTTDHAVPVLPGGGTATVTVTTGQSVYYSTDADVTPTHNEGTITVGTPVAFVNPVWLLSAGFSTATVQLDSASPAAGGGGADVLLSTVTLSSAGNFDVSSISASYNDLIIVAITRDTNASTTNGLLLKLNNDGGSNYYSEAVTVQGSGTVSGSESLALTLLGIGNSPGSTSPADHFGVCQLTIFGYASTTWRKVLSWEAFAPGSLATATLKMIRGGGLWNSTAAVNRVAVFSGATLVAGSQLRIYGRT